MKIFDTIINNPRLAEFITGNALAIGTVIVYLIQNFGVQIGLTPEIVTFLVGLGALLGIRGTLDIRNYWMDKVESRDKKVNYLSSEDTAEDTPEINYVKEEMIEEATLYDEKV